jgi:predicted acyltransferase (DUF342 family)
MNSRLFVGQDVSMNSRLFVGQDVSMNSRLFVGQDVSLNSRLFVNSDTSMNSRLFVGQDVNFNNRVLVGSDVSLGGRLFVNSNSFYVNGQLFSGGSVFATDISTQSRLFVNQDASINLRIFVGSDASLGGRLFVSGNVFCNSQIQGQSFNATSDYRIKTNIEQLNNTYTVKNLIPRKYYHKVLGRQDLGLIAHELQEEYPLLVQGEKDGENLQTVNYNGLIPILINDFQNQQKQITALIEEIEILKEKINKLENEK